LRVAQLVREKRTQDLECERMEQELRIACLIQQTLLPKEIPELTGWQISSYYQPARAVGGDFYGFLSTQPADGESQRNHHWRTLAELFIPSVPGNERLAMAQVARLYKNSICPANSANTSRRRWPRRR
jgi:hypothetical protein